MHALEALSAPVGAVRTTHRSVARSSRILVPVALVLPLGIGAGGVFAHGSPAPDEDVKPVDASSGAHAESPTGPARRSLSDSGDLLIDRGPGRLKLVIPASEQLDFDVLLDVALVGDTRVGRFRLTSGVEPYRSGLPLSSGQPIVPLEAAGKSGEPSTGWIRAKAWGHYLGYDLDHNIEMRHLPQAWPEVIYADRQEGSEHRQREMRYGWRDNAPSYWYRSDGHCRGCTRKEHYLSGGLFSGPKHCKKCKRHEHRIWREPQGGTIPEGGVDMLSAIYLSRTFMREGRSEVSFPLLDKTKYWNLKLQRGKSKAIKTGVGTFRCRDIRFIAQPSEKSDSKFKGLFGIHGTLHIWLEEKTGIPVLIGGLVPLGPLDIEVKLQLREYSGTPEDFRPVTDRKK